jgi:hypothetical protein
MKTTEKKKIGISKAKKPKNRLSEAEKRKKRALRLLDQLKGIGQGIWNEDAQDYVNKLRSNDRF